MGNQVAHYSGSVLTLDESRGKQVDFNPSDPNSILALAVEELARTLHSSMEKRDPSLSPGHDDWLELPEDEKELFRGCIGDLVYEERLFISAFTAMKRLQLPCK